MCVLRIQTVCSNVIKDASVTRKISKHTPTQTHTQSRTRTRYQWKSNNVEIITFERESTHKSKEGEGNQMDGVWVCVFGLFRLRIELKWNLKCEKWDTHTCLFLMPGVSESTCCFVVCQRGYQSTDWEHKFFIDWTRVPSTHTPPPRTYFLFLSFQMSPW